MNVIQPNCRIQFTAEDVEFILSVIGKRPSAAECLVALLSDEAARDAILDDEQLYHALLERRGCLKVSGHFYFYILVRNIFKRSGISSREVADYVAEVLAEFSRTENARCRIAGTPEPFGYLVDLLAALKSADDHTRFYIQAHIGNQSLFMTGIFADRIRHRAEVKGAPDLSYYERMGRMNFKMAGDHRLARRYELVPIFQVLSDRFQETRIALNDLTDRLLSVGDANRSVDVLLAQGAGGD